jgi:hypothetical protein
LKPKPGTPVEASSSPSDSSSRQEILAPAGLAAKVIAEKEAKKQASNSEDKQVKPNFNIIKIALVNKQPAKTPKNIVPSIKKVIVLISINICIKILNFKF